MSTTTLPPVRFSSLKHLAKSPAHYRYALDHPPEPSRPMRLGSAVDAFIFGHVQVAVSECATRRSKQWDQFEADNAGSVLLTPSEAEIAIGMVESLKRHKEAMDLLSGTAQKTIEWDIAFRKCRGTPDLSSPYLVDLKTCRTAHPDWFLYDAIRMGYHAQIDWYRNGLQIHGAPEPKRKAIVAVENAAPHVVTIFEPTVRALIAGRKLWTTWFERLRVCEESNYFPGYVEGVAPFDVLDSEPAKLVIDGEEVEVE